MSVRPFGRKLRHSQWSYTGILLDPGRAHPSGADLRPMPRTRAVRKEATVTSQPSDPASARDTLRVGDRSYDYYRLDAAGAPDLEHLPYTVKVLLENMLRGAATQPDLVTEADVRALAAWDPTQPAEAELPFMPARVILQDFTGVPCVVDLAAMRDAVADMGGDPSRINPLVPADLVRSEEHTSELQSPCNLVCR